MFAYNLDHTIVLAVCINSTEPKDAVRVQRYAEKHGPMEKVEVGIEGLKNILYDRKNFEQKQNHLSFLYIRRKGVSVLCYFPLKIYFILPVIVLV